MNFAVPADQRVKLKEDKKRDKYLDLARDQKKPSDSDGDTNCNWCAQHSHQRICTRTGGLRRGRVETIQTTALFRSVRIVRRVLEI